MDNGQPAGRPLGTVPESDLPPWLRPGQVDEPTARLSTPAVSPVAPNAAAPPDGLPPWLDQPVSPQPEALPPATVPALPPASPTPSDPPPRRRLALVGAGIVALGVLGGVVGWQLTRDDGATAGPPAERSAAATSPASAQSSVPVLVPTPEPSVPSPTVAKTTPSPTPNPEARAERELTRLANRGLADHSLDNRWVAQLASKWVGIKDPLQVTESGSHRFNAVDILAEHRRLELETTDGSDVFMLRGTDYGKGYRPKGKILWVTFADGGFSSLEGVKDWCGSRFPGLSGDKLLNQCFPTRLRPLKG